VDVFFAQENKSGENESNAQNQQGNLDGIRQTLYKAVDDNQGGIQQNSGIQKILTHGVHLTA
jgi:hypothetical protein